ncbi:hypothetical protein CAPTEDRAFT_178141 [Capitella teleta]|uniref:Sin3 histone deacetylase corepressor complex component SDS3 n=1 Tax=Capitella teleta TaxID=283909 RepID=R7ULC4_CAPTE|nr:hypothetical protein CAPTEDRAFT_178141 [Capitella teleta]|eukprot:ELU04052.1 hypothetical protein CAPTEDRAFT_178141 [Capitella teleta]
MTRIGSLYFLHYYLTDTEDASETDMISKEEEFTGIKEQMYQDKLAQLKQQLQQLKNGTLPEYMKKLKKIDQQYKERLRYNEIWLNYEAGYPILMNLHLERVENDYINEKKNTASEFEVKKIELKENLILELEDKRRHVDGDRVCLELTGDSMDVKPASTRKLRRRPNDPMPVPEKRRKASPAQLNILLGDDEIQEDLRLLNKICGKPLSKKPVHSPIVHPLQSHVEEHVCEARIEDGRLHYEKKWFSRGQPVFIENKEAGKVGAVITAVGTAEIWLRKISDNAKLRIYVKQLQNGKYSLRRRNS